MKTSFKRIALAVVASLGFGLLASSGPAYAAAGTAIADETLTLSASSATINLGETATVTVTNTYVSGGYSTALGQVDSRVIYMTGTNGVATILAQHTTDSANITVNNTPEVTVTPTAGSETYVESGVVSAGFTFTKQTITVKFYRAATAGTYTYTFTSRDRTGAASTKTATFTLTVTDNTAADRTKSKVYLTAPNGWTDAGALVQTNFLRASAYTGGKGAVGTVLGYPTADSTIVTSAGLPTASSGYVAKGILWVDLRNASDTFTVYPGGTATAVRDSAVVTTTVGQLQTFARGTASGTFAKSVTIDPMTDTVVVYSDGSAGTAEINTYLGTSSATANLIAAKSVTFVGKATSFTITETASTTAPTASLSAVRADSILSGTRIISFVAKDANAKNVDSAALNTNSNFYCISSDSKVVTAVGSTTAAHTAASYSVALGNWGCSMQVRDSGTATITVADSTTVASSAYTATSKTFTFAGAAWTGTIAFDKTTYAPGEKALLTVTVKDRNGYTVANSANTGNHNPFTNLIQDLAFGGAGLDGNGTAAGITNNTLQGNSFSTINGVDTYLVTMPTYSSKINITALTSYVDSVTNTPVSVTLSVVNPQDALIAAAQAAAAKAGTDAVAAAKAAQAAAEKAATDAVAAAKAAQDAAVAEAKKTADAAVAAADAAADAANEAIDAANAATDAANLSAEAADAATVAAEEARDAADAATAAVEELATQVATLMAALKAQITTLANTVAKIAKKVKA